MYEIIKEFIKPEFVLLIPVLYIIGAGLKVMIVPDKWIPLILGCTGILICAIYVLATTAIDGWQSILLGIFTAIVQGILCAGASVYFNQVIKQAKKDE